MRAGLPRQRAESVRRGSAGAPDCQERRQEPAPGRLDVAAILGGIERGASVLPLSAETQAQPRDFAFSAASSNSSRSSPSIACSASRAFGSDFGDAAWRVADLRYSRSAVLLSSPSFF